MKINLDFLKKINVVKIRKAIFGHSAAKGIIGKIAIYILLIGVSYVFIYPILRMIVLSFMTRTDILNPEVDWIPSSLQFGNFYAANLVLELLPPSWTKEGLTIGERILGTFGNTGNLFKSLRNIGFLALIQTTIAALTGFAFARYNFKFKKFWFVMVLMSFIIPLPMVTIPRIMIVSNLQDSIWNPLFEATMRGTFLDGFFKPTLFQTLVPQILLAIFGQGINSAILILIFYNFFKMIPISLDEAARIDGASSPQVFWHIYIKLVIPIIMTVFLFSFIWNWNDVYSARIFFNANNPLLTMKLSIFDSVFDDIGPQIPGEGGISMLNEGFKMAGTFLSILPLMIIYFFAQRKFIEGIEQTGITGE